MMRLLHAADPIIDVEDAGTTMRFLTAYFAVTNQQKTLTGTSRMLERPIGILVKALRSLGARIEYLQKDGFPPIRIAGFDSQKTRTVRVRGDISSQFISALMMVAPALPMGLVIELEGVIGSRPYIEMTAALMRQFGVSSTFEGARIEVASQHYTATELTVESDWSGASYWYAFAALADDGDLSLPGLSLDSLQGDRAIADLMALLGVNTEVQPGGVLRLTRNDTQQKIQWDFKNCPDLAQTVAVVCAAKGVHAVFTGLESLRIKETDRIAALQTELGKIGARLLEDKGSWRLQPAEILPASASFNTYKDHRMAMAFAPLAAKMDVTIDNPSVVKKSYPDFWVDMAGVGFAIS